MKTAHDIRPILQEAMTLHQQGEIGRAEAIYRDVLRTHPQEPNAWHLMGVAAWQRGDLEKAESYIRKAISFNGTAQAYHANLGGVLKQKGDLDAAIRSYREALRLRPDDHEAKKGLTESYAINAHGQASRFQWEEAQASYRSLLQLSPADAGALNNLAQILQNSGRPEEALPLYDRAITIRTDHALTYYNRGICRIGENDFAAGWQDIDRSVETWLPLMDAKRSLPWREVPLWDGSPLHGKRIILWGDQGIGDEILFAGMIPDLTAQGAIVTVECMPRLVSLFQRSFPDIMVVGRATPPLPTGDFDYQAPGLWLTRRLRPDFNAFPVRQAYLKSDHAMSQLLRARYAAQGKPKIIGLSWHSTTIGFGAHRGIDLAQLVPYLPHDDVTYLDLQYGDTQGERDTVHKDFPDFHLYHDPIVDQMADMDMFAAQIAACDGIVTIGNTAAHLAGALGIPGAVLIPQAARTWYWFRDQAQAPFYPSLKLLRGNNINAWAPALPALKAAVGYCQAKPAPALDATLVEKKLGDALQARGHLMVKERRLDDAKSSYRRALILDPHHAATLNNLAMILHHEGDLVSARNHYDRALKAGPQNMAIRYNRAYSYLTEKNFEEGWNDIVASESHWRHLQDPRKNLPWATCPLWDGSALRGKSILLSGDQSIGDEILYIGMVQDLIARGALVTVECIDRLVPLVTRSFPDITVMSRQNPPLLKVNYDFHVPGLWLARWLRHDIKSFPGRTSFLKADPTLTTKLRKRYEAFGRKRIIGLAWHTSSQPWGRMRSIPLSEMLASFDLRDVLIVDLQYGDTAEAWVEARRVFPDLAMIHDEDIDQTRDMDGYAAQIAACDVVMSIANTTSHMAGSLGVHAAILMPNMTLSWYWFAEGEISPWYPSLTILRPDIPDRLRRAAAIASGTGS